MIQIGSFQLEALEGARGNDLRPIKEDLGQSPPNQVSKAPWKVTLWRGE